MLPGFHILLRERLLPQAHAQCLSQADRVNIVELVDRAGVSARTLCRKFLILENEADELVVLVGKDVEGVPEMVAVLVWILCDPYLRRAVLELSHWRSVLVGCSEFIILSEGSLEVRSG